MAGDDLRRKPWQPFEIDNHNYLLKSAFTEDSYEILCYDMTTLWYEKCDMKNLKKITKKLNPSVEMPLPRLLTHLESTIESQQDTVKYTVQKTDDNKLVVSMDSDLTKGVPFTWQFQCQTANAMLASHVTIPLLIMVTELQRRTEQLQRIIKTKDSEIEDYKLGGARVSRSKSM
uniref:Non-homologous end-joining factor 1 n=1 Tax=Saccoglossus kowalevskii TaxID=10224 RepID=A0ABM0MPG3_SACKO|nr:PREDICTED: non-homologous end-joining factor 1-like [Saccoglossus kowalevskii]